MCENTFNYQTKPSDPEPFRVLGAVKYEMKDYEGSAAAYKSSAMVSIPPPPQFFLMGI